MSLLREWVTTSAQQSLGKAKSVKTELCFYPGGKLRLMRGNKAAQRCLLALHVPLGACSVSSLRMLQPEWERAPESSLWGPCFQCVSVGIEEVLSAAGLTLGPCTTM